MFSQVFRYNATEDRLELCLEPHGHFAIEPNLEARVLGGMASNQPTIPPTASSAPSASSTLGQVQRDVSIGGSGVIVNKSMQPCKQVAFTGHAHSLGGGATTSSAGSDDKMPQDLQPQSHPNHHPKLKAMKFHSFSHSGSRPSSIDEEDEEGDESKKTTSEVPMETVRPSEMHPAEHERKYKRIGPGYTVLQQEDTNELNATSETFQALASQIDSLVEDMDVEEESSHKGVEPKGEDGNCSHREALQEENEILPDRAEVGQEKVSGKSESVDTNINQEISPALRTDVVSLAMEEDRPVEVASTLVKQEMDPPVCESETQRTVHDTERSKNVEVDVQSSGGVADTRSMDTTSASNASSTMLVNMSIH